MIEVKMQVGWIKKIDFPTLTGWLTENVEEGNWDFVLTNGNMFDATPLFTFVSAEDAITFRLKFGL